MQQEPYYDDEIDLRELIQTLFMIDIAIGTTTKV